MSTLVNLPEKRQNLGLDQIPEQPPEKHPELDDPQPGEVNETAMVLQSNSKSQEDKSSGDSKSSTDKKRLYYCVFWRANVDHITQEYPDKSKVMGIGCVICLGPCKMGEEHNHWQLEMMKFCVICGSQGNHWSDDSAADRFFLVK